MKPRRRPLLESLEPRTLLTAVGTFWTAGDEGLVDRGWTPADAAELAEAWPPQDVAVRYAQFLQLDEGDVEHLIRTGPAVSVDPASQGRTGADVSVTNGDNAPPGTAGITVNPTSGLTTPEAGGTATFTIVLNTQPTADVVIAVNSSDVTEGLVWPTHVTFTTTNWNVIRTITVSGEDDFLDDGDVAFTVVTGAATSSDANYSGLDAADVAVTNLDDDAAGIAVSGVNRDTTEAGGMATFIMVLASQPTEDVTIGLSSSDASEGTVTPASVTFTAAKWSRSQVITVRGVDDDLDDGDVGYTIVTAAASSADPNFSGRNATDVPVTNRDDDTAGITVSPASSLTVTEAGGTASFTVVLTAQPATNVVLTVTSGDTGEARVSPAVLTFTPAVWNSPQTVMIAGVDDFDRDGDQVTSVTVAIDAAQSDHRFAAVAAQTVSVTTIDNDVGWSNPRNPFDVDDNGKVDAADVLMIINYINAHSSNLSLPPPPAAPPPFYDVNNDGRCAPIDVLLVINYINSHVTAGSGEGEDVLREATTPDVACPVTNHDGAMFWPANAQFVSASSTGPQIAGESAARPAIGEHPEPVSTWVLSRHAADPHLSARPSRTTGSAAGGQNQALDAALETWEQGIEDDLVAMLARDIGRSSC